MTSSDSTFARLSQRAGDLYTLPAVAMKVLELTGNDQVDTQSLKDHLENDPALCAKLLRVVNSSLFGLNRSVDDLNQALALLGTKPLKLLVLGFSLPEKLMEAGPAEALAQYWRFALTKAVAARQASETLWEKSGDDAFLAGLLEDIGMLVMMRELGTPYYAFLSRVFKLDTDLCRLEQDSLGFDHVELSAELLERWQLPNSIVSAVGRPRTLTGLAKLPDDQSFLPQVAHLANLIAQLVVQRRLSVLPDVIESGQRFCGLTKSKLTALIVCLEENVDSLAEVLSLQLPAGMEYVDVLRRAHEQLSLVASEAAATLIGQQEREAANEQRLLDEAEELAAATRRLVSESDSESKTGLNDPEGAYAKNPEHETDSHRGATSSMTSALANPATTEIETVNQKFRRELVQRLAIVVAACRQRRCELSLLVVASEDQDVTGAVEIALPADGIASQSACSRSPSPGSPGPGAGVDHPLAETWLMSRSQFAIILPGCDRKEAVHQAQQLLRRLSASREPNNSEESSSKLWCVGASTVPFASKNFDPVSLIDAAERCLFGARAGSGATVKSIEVS